MTKKDKLNLTTALFIRMQDTNNPVEYERSIKIFLDSNGFREYIKSIVYCEISKRRYKLTRDQKKYYCLVGIEEILSDFQYEIIGIKNEEIGPDIKEKVIRLIGKITRRWIEKNIPRFAMDPLDKEIKGKKGTCRLIEILINDDILSDERIAKKEMMFKIFKYLAYRLEFIEWEIFNNWWKFNKTHKEVAIELGIPIHKVHDTFRKIKRIMKKSYFKKEIYD